jgi:hypothetical protein
MKARHKKGKAVRGSVRVNISLPITLSMVSLTVTSKKGYGGLSDYVQAYLRKDAASLGMRQFEMAT